MVREDTREIHQLHYNNSHVEVSVDTEGNMSIAFIGKSSFDLDAFNEIAKFVENISNIEPV